jgi:hypothetical protein
MVRALSLLAPGDEVYGLQQAPRGANGYDALTPEGTKVQVKANFAASQIGFRGEADVLLCLKIDLLPPSDSIIASKVTAVRRRRLLHDPIADFRCALAGGFVAAAF